MTRNLSSSDRSLPQGRPLTFYGWLITTNARIWLMVASRSVLEINLVPACRGRFPVPCGRYTFNGTRGHILTTKTRFHVRFLVPSIGTRRDHKKQPGMQTRRSLLIRSLLRRIITSGR